MHVELWNGADAWARLESPPFREAWGQLYAECPWASVFQSPGFAGTWYDVYRSRFSPLLVGATDGDDRLRALLLLAVDGDGRLAAAGDRQAEYQVWLARDGEGDAFIAAAMERLAVEYPSRTLSLQYLPAGTPREWLSTGRGLAGRCVLRAVPRALMQITPEQVDAMIRKKGNRTRLRRLERYGAVAYERLTDPATIDAVLGEMAAPCDLRNGALHDVLPFTGDPLKLRFHRALARVPGVMCFSVLRCGERTASLLVDAENREHLTLGFTALSPSLARHSPGSIHTLLLAREAAVRGFGSIDLTPGGAAYKDLLATGFDDVYTLRVFFDARRFVAYRAKEATRRAAKVLVDRAGPAPAAIRERFAALREGIDAAGAGSKPARALRALRKRVWSEGEVALYEFDDAAVAALPDGGSMRVDRFDDLVSYRSGLADGLPRRAFLRRAVARLERGAHAYTRADGGDLVAAAWVSTPPVAPVEAELASAVPSDAALVHDLAAVASLRRWEEWVRVLPQLVRDAARVPGVTRVILAVPREQRDVAEAARRLGGALAGSLFESTHLGRRRRWSTVAVRARAEAASEMRPAEVRG
jgi:CelD/BcsL family acetyltransferase involved in cellulose biosynthesis